MAFSPEVTVREVRAGAKERRVTELPGIDEDAGEVVIEWASPGFETAVPDVRNAGLIPPGVLQAMAPCWGTRRFPDSTVRLCRFRDVFVVGEGLVFGQDLRVARVSLTQHSAEETRRALARLQEAIAAGSVMRDGGVTLLCQKRGMANFGHWLVELLPIAHLGLPWIGRGEWRVLAPLLLGPMGAVVRDSLAMAGVPRGQCRFGDGRPRLVEELLVVEGLTLHGAMVSPLVLACFDALKAGVAADEGRRLWISRRGTPRRLEEEEAVERRLRALGWRVIEPGMMTLREQVAAFKGAREVAGVLGAGLTGIVFAPPGIRVTSFAPAAMPDTFFWLLATLRGQRHVEVRVPHRSGAHGDKDYDAALEMPVGEVLGALVA